jgi:Flp pilus assembly protein TadG
MKDAVKSQINTLLHDECGQALVWMALLMVLFLGMCGLTVDVSYALAMQRKLQASADAAALAGARTLPNSNYSSVALSYSSVKGSANEYGFAIDTPAVTGKCLATVSDWGNPCSATSPNAVTVTQSATIHTFFAAILGFKTLRISATATASRGANPQPYNIAIILDTTPSMDLPDPYCGNLTQLQCANQGIQTLLSGLAPSLDSVSLFTFPNVSTSTVGYDFDCSNSGPTAHPYTFPSTTATNLSTMPYKSGFSTVQMTYQVTGYLNDYRTSDKATSLNTVSNLTKAVGAKSNCTGIQTSNQNTYYASAIYAAQASLIAAAAANPGTQNVIILLSDGNATGKNSGSFHDFSTGTESTTVANSSGYYPSWVGQCGQGIEAAKYASNYRGNPTQVFTIAYGAPTTSSTDKYNLFGQLAQVGNCSSDVGAGTHSNITPCQAMQQMSSGRAAIIHTSTPTTSRRRETPAALLPIRTIRLLHSITSSNPSWST